jgi:8-oxo-dGTP pyrophosphatase MutT (NUDIX family)
MTLKGGIPEELNCEVLHETKWLKLINLTDPEQGVHGYVCTHAPWSNGHAVAVLPYRVIVGKLPNGDLGTWREYLLRQEVTPCWGMAPSLSSITGGMDKSGEAPIACASRELHEEGGYIVPADRSDLWIDLGPRHMGKASTTVMHMFAVDLTAEAREEAPGDGTELEAKAYCEWRRDPESAVDVLVGSMAFALHMAIDKS